MNKKLLEKYISELSKATPEQKDLITANILMVLHDYLDILEKIAKNSDQDSKAKKLNKEIKEIEDTISLGVPGWIKYTRKVRKRKK